MSETYPGGFGLRGLYPELRGHVFRPIKFSLVFLCVVFRQLDLVTNAAHSAHLENAFRRTFRRMQYTSATNIIFREWAHCRKASGTFGK